MFFSFRYQKLYKILTLVGLVLVCACFSLGVFSGRIVWDYEVKKSQNGYIVLRNQEERGNFDWCSATDKKLYFSYSGKNGGVDVYDRDGRFLYWIYFKDIDKGSIKLRAENELIYIMLRNGAVYVFKGDALVSKHSDTEAVSKGYDIGWFREASSGLEVTDTYVYFLDDAGNRIDQITTPYNVHPGFSASNMREGHPVGLVVVIAFFLFGFGFIIYRYCQDFKQKR